MKVWAAAATILNSLTVVLLSYVGLAYGLAVKVALGGAQTPDDFAAGMMVGAFVVLILAGATVAVVGAVGAGLIWRRIARGGLPRKRGKFVLVLTSVLPLIVVAACARYVWL